MRAYFDTLYGNEATKNILGRQIARGEMSHALLIEGEDGSGKSTLASLISAALICENRQSADVPLPCGKCRACRLALTRNAPDIHVIDKGDKATLGVDAVREAREDMFLSATEFDSKIYIFKDAHTMTPQAQNSLLIVLEEPPEGVHILLLCRSADAMLTTVRSRARLCRMQKFTPDEIRAYLQENREELFRPYAGKEDELLAVLTAARGSIGEAVRLLSPKNKAELRKERETVTGVIDAMATGTYAALCDAFDAFPAKRDDLLPVLELLLSALRDLTLLKKSEAAPLCFYTDRAAAAETAERFRITSLLTAADATDDAIRKCERNANVATVLNVLQGAFHCG